jgi:hypothetical protein
MHRRVARKLLVASLGVASVSYVACGRTETPDGTDAGLADGSTKDSALDRLVANLVAPPEDARSEELVANLVAPPEDASIKDTGGG